MDRGSFCEPPRAQAEKQLRRQHLLDANDALHLFALADPDRDALGRHYLPPWRLSGYVFDNAGVDNG
jgi:hypothetical protein